MSRVKVEWRDIDPLVQRKCIDAVGDAADFLLEQANIRVPHDEGHLMRSGTVTTSNSAPVANVSYDTPYAKRLHEHPEYNFQGGRQGKWLESALDQNRGKLNAYIANRVKEAFD